MRANPFLYVVSEGIYFLKFNYFVSSVFTSAAYRGWMTTAQVATGPALPLAQGIRHQSLPQPPSQGLLCPGRHTGHMTYQRKSSHWRSARASRTRSPLWFCLDTWCGFKSGHLPCPTSLRSLQSSPLSS